MMLAQWCPALRSFYRGRPSAGLARRSEGVGCRRELFQSRDGFCGGAPARAQSFAAVHLASTTAQGDGRV